jgi:hypothetical protein
MGTNLLAHSHGNGIKRGQPHGAARLIILNEYWNHSL